MARRRVNDARHQLPGAARRSHQRAAVGNAATDCGRFGGTTLPLQTRDIVRVQTVLDVIDVHLAKPGKSTAAPIAANRIVAMMIAVIALPAGQFAVLLSVVLAIFQPASQIAVAAGVAAMASAVLTWRDLPS